MPPKPQETDALVMGWTPAGAVAAAALAEAGFRVTVAEVDPPEPASGETRIPAGAPLGQLLRDLGLGKLARSTAGADARAPILQLVLPRGRLDLTRDDAHNRRELRRELGSAELWDALRELGNRQDRRLHAWRATRPATDGTASPDPWVDVRRDLARALRHSGVEDLVRATAPLLPVAARDVDAASGLRLWWRRLQPDRPPLARLLSALRHVFEESGGRWIKPAPDHRLHSRFGRPDGLRDAELRLRFRTLIWALPSAWLIERLDTRLFARGLRRRLTTGSPVVHRLTLQVGLARAGLPDAMGPALALADDAPGARPALWIRTRRPADPSEPAVLEITAEGSGPSDPDRLRALREETLERLRLLLPFLEEHLCWTWCPQLPDAAGGPAPPPGLAARPRPALQLSPLPAPETAFGGLPLVPGPSRLVLASAETYPRLGLEGELLAGARAADLARRLLSP